MHLRALLIASPKNAEVMKNALNRLYRGSTEEIEAAQQSIVDKVRKVSLKKCKEENIHDKRMISRRCEADLAAKKKEIESETTYHYGLRHQWKLYAIQTVHDDHR